MVSSRGSDDEMGTHVGDTPAHEDDQSSIDRGSGGVVTDAKSSGNDGGSEGGGSHHDSFGSRERELDGNNEGSGGGNNSGSNISESEEETPKIKLTDMPTKIQSETDPNASQNQALLEFNDKD